MFGIIDRFEKNLVVVELEDDTIVSIEKSKIPIGAKEGDVLRINDHIIIDYEQTEERRKKIEELTKDLWIE